MITETAGRSTAAGIAWRCVRMRIPRALTRLPARLSGGIAPLWVAALAALVLVALLYEVARTEQEQSRGYAEFTMFPEGCTVDPERRRNVLRCRFIREGLYRVVFSRSLGEGTPLVSRGSCCPGRIAGSIESDSSVLIAVPPLRRDPVRATVFVP
jgi:hypothetical protein